MIRNLSISMILLQISCNKKLTAVLRGKSFITIQDTKFKEYQKLQREKKHSTAKQGPSQYNKIKTKISSQSRLRGSSLSTETIILNQSKRYRIRVVALNGTLKRILRDSINERTARWKLNRGESFFVPANQRSKCNELSIEHIGGVFCQGASFHGH